MSIKESLFDYFAKDHDSNLAFTKALKIRRTRDHFPFYGDNANLGLGGLISESATARKVAKLNHYTQEQLNQVNKDINWKYQQAFMKGHTTVGYDAINVVLSALISSWAQPLIIAYHACKLVAAVIAYPFFRASQGKEDAAKVISNSGDQFVGSIYNLVMNNFFSTVAFVLTKSANTARIALVGKLNEYGARNTQKQTLDAAHSDFAHTSKPGVSLDNVKQFEIQTTQTAVASNVDDRVKTASLDDKTVDLPEATPMTTEMYQVPSATM